MHDKRAAIGIVGLGVMGRNLALNIAEHGSEVAGYDRDPEKVKQLGIEAQTCPVSGYESLSSMIDALDVPRTILLLVPAGKPVDTVIADLLSHLAPQDCIIDGGNSHFRDTDLRCTMLASKNIHFIGMGISGGEKGARHGPCMMPGGDRHTFERVKSILEKCAARVDGEPCFAYCGPGSAGHYIKMVHNGIEYGILQLIAETYDLAKRGLGVDDARLSEMYRQWNSAESESFLIENTAFIFGYIDPRTRYHLIDLILDAARQKGTGRWTSQDAMDLQLPVPTIDASVSSRNMSMHIDDRFHASTIFGEALRLDTDEDTFLRTLQNAYFAAALITYGQGIQLLSAASEKYTYDFNPATIVKIWRGGCIIRARLLGHFRNAYDRTRDIANPLFDPGVAELLCQRIDDLRTVVVKACKAGIPVPAFSSCLWYLDSLRSKWLPANLIQALRDDFGSHTYERIDDRGVFHTQWIGG
jgi:6-phosphogluconate dehydrogenase